MICSGWSYSQPRVISCSCLGLNGPSEAGSDLDTYPKNG